MEIDSLVVLLVIIALTLFAVAWTEIYLINVAPDQNREQTVFSLAER